MNPAKDAIEGAHLFNQHGLPGLVIFLLFGALFWSIYWYSKNNEKTSTEHRSERQEWRESNERQTDKLEGAIKEISSALSRNPLR